MISNTVPIKSSRSRDLNQSLMSRTYISSASAILRFALRRTSIKTAIESQRVIEKKV